MEITFDNFPDLGDLSISEIRVSNWIESTVSGSGYSVGTLHYTFVDDREILEMNRTWLNHDYYTDIITFDHSAGKEINGDIFIGLDTVKSNAGELGISFRDELLRVIIHGVLHLTGCDDQTPEQKSRMRKLENEALEKFDVPRETQGLK